MVNLARDSANKWAWRAFNQRLILLQLHSVVRDPIVVRRFDDLIMAKRSRNTDPRRYEVPYRRRPRPNWQHEFGGAQADQNLI
jgi:hypothetical protein